MINTNNLILIEIVSKDVNSYHYKKCRNKHLARWQSSLIIEKCKLKLHWDTISHHQMSTNPKVWQHLVRVDTLCGWGCGESHSAHCWEKTPPWCRGIWWEQQDTRVPCHPHPILETFSRSHWSKMCKASPLHVQSKDQKPNAHPQTTGWMDRQKTGQRERSGDARSGGTVEGLSLGRGIYVCKIEQLLEKHGLCCISCNMQRGRGIHAHVFGSKK